MSRIISNHPHFVASQCLKKENLMSCISRSASRIALASLIAALIVTYSAADEPKPGVPGPQLQQKAVAILHEAMRKGLRFEKVHAAEALLWSGQPRGVREFYLEEKRTLGLEPPYRIGIWRVLKRTSAANSADERQCLDALLQVLGDAQAKDRGTAAETLAKLKYAERTPVVLDLAEHGKADLRVSARWILANAGRAGDEARLVEMFQSSVAQDRFYSAYALRHFKTIRPASLAALRDLAAKERADGEVRCYVLGALYTHLPAAEKEWAKRELLGYAASGNTGQRYQSCMALANWPTNDMAPAAEKLLGNQPVDERIGGAYLLLKIGRARDKADPNH